MRKSGKEAEGRQRVGNDRPRERLMGTRPGKGSRKPAVQRRFEGNRLARTFQVQAYEQVLPAMVLAGQARAWSKPMRSEEGKCPSQGGVAA